MAGDGSIFGMMGEWTWWIVAMVLGILELLVPGIFFIWLAIAAVIVGVVVLLLPIALSLQIAIFAILSVALVWLSRTYLTRHPIVSDHPHLNQRGRDYIGQVFNLDQPIENGRGRLKIGDSYWMARGPDAPTGTKVRVIAMDGSILLVELVA